MSADGTLRVIDGFAARVREFSAAGAAGCEIFGDDRMNTDIGIWTINQKSGAGRKVDLADGIETEKMLEDVLVANPNMLMGGLTLVGRQIPVGTGAVDLLGIDEEGRLVVFELKRGKLTRAAVAQILDYCTYLENLSNRELATLIAERSGKREIKKIADFEEWYANQPGDSIRPIRMVLVGLGVDTSADRMVGYLAARDIDIRLLTFHGYKLVDSLLLARQVRTAEDGHASPGGRPSASSLNRKASEFGVAEIWQDAKSVVGLRYRKILYAVRHYLPAANDHTARRRACPWVAFRVNRRVGKDSNHVLSSGGGPRSQTSRRDQEGDFVQRGEAAECSRHASRSAAIVLPP